MKIRPVASELFHVDRQTDRHDEANSRFFFFAILRTSLKTELLCRLHNVLYYYYYYYLCRSIVGPVARSV